MAFMNSIKVLTFTLYTLVGLCNLSQSTIDGVDHEEVTSMLRASLAFFQDRESRLTEIQEISQRCRTLNDLPEELECLRGLCMNIPDPMETFRKVIGQNILAAQNNIKSMGRLLTDWETFTTPNQVLYFFNNLLQTFNHRLEQRQENHHITPWTIPDFIFIQECPFSAETIEKTIKSHRDAADLIKTIAQMPFMTEHLDNSFRDYQAHPIVGGHFAVLEAYARGLVEDPPLPDHFMYRYVPTQIASAASAMAKATLKGMREFIEMSTIQYNKYNDAKQHIAFLEGVEQYAIECLEDYKQTGGKGLLILNELTTSLTHEVLEEVLKEFEAEQKKKQKAREKKHRQKANKAARADESLSGTPGVESFDTRAHSPISLVENAGSASAAQENADEEEPETTRSAPTKAPLPLPRKEDCLSGAHSDGRILLSSKVYALMSTFWRAPSMDWGDFSTLWTKIGFGIKSKSGSHRQFMKDNRLIFTAHEPHGSYYDDKLGSQTLKMVREALQKHFGWSLESFSQK